MAPDDLAVAQPQRARRLHVFQAAVAEELGAHVIAQADPAKQAQQHQQQQERGLEDRGKDDQQVQLGQRTPDFHRTLKQQVDLAAEVTLHGAHEDADQGAHGSQRQRKPHADAKAVDQPRQQVAALAVGAEVVACVGCRRRQRGVKVVQRICRMRVQREHRQVAGFGQQFSDERVLPVGARFKVTTQRLFTGVAEQRHHPLAVDARQQRAVIAD